MSGLPDTRAVSISTAGYEDGLGRRSVRFDREVGGMLECLHLRPEFWGFEKDLRARAEAIASLDDERFVKVRAIERDAHGLVVVSELIPGGRLVDIVDARLRDDSAAFGIDAGIGFLLQTLPALATLHTLSMAHGALAPGRLLVTPASQVVLLDGIYAAALERLNLSRSAMWSNLGLLASPFAGAPRFDRQSDVVQVACSALVLAIGRPLEGTGAASTLAPLVREVRELAEIRAGGAFAEGVHRFFSTALPVGSRPPQLTADEATAEAERLADMIGEEGCHSAFSHLTRLEPAPIRPAAPAIVGDFAFEYDEDELEDEWEEAAEAETQDPVIAASQIEPSISTPPLTAPVPARPSASPIPELSAEPAVTVHAEVPPAAAVRPDAQEPLAIPPPASGLEKLRPIASPMTVVSTEPVRAFSAPTVTPIAADAPLAPTLVPPPPLAPVVAAFVPVPVPPPIAPAQPAPSVALAPPPAPRITPVIAAPVPVPMVAPPITIAPPAALSTPIAPLVAPPPIVAPQPIGIAVTPPAQVRVRTEPPAGYTPARTAPEPPVRGVLFGDRSAHEQPKRLPWKLAAAAVLVLAVGAYAGQGYLQGPAEKAPPPAEPPKPAAAGLVPAVGTTGGLTIDTQPTGAKVSIDGADAGITPLKLENLAPGKHTVVVTTESATVRRTVRVEAGRILTLDIPVYSGWVVVFSPIPLDIAAAGATLGNTDTGRIILPPGRHVLTLTNRAYGYSETRAVEILPGEERPLNVEPKGLVNVNAHPWAEVWIDGKKAGDTPIANLPVLLGTRVFVFKHPQYGERRLTTTITSKPAALTIDLTKP